MSLETIEKETAQEAEKRRRLKEFETTPENFIHVTDVIIAAVKSEHGTQICLGACKRNEMEAALSRLTYKVFSLFSQMDMAALLKQKESEIILPPGTDKGGDKKIIV